MNSAAGINSPPPGGDAGRLPIVIGVTGHRHLREADLAGYRARIREFLDHLGQRYPATPLRVISALAAGADRVVAQLALEGGHELIVPLPLQPDDYERDFPDSVAEFRNILQRVPPEQVFVLPRPGMGGSQWVEVQAERDHQYREVGAFVAEQSHILLAIWDGIPDETSVGTAGVIALKLGRSGSRRALAEGALDPDDSGPVFHVHAVRSHSEADSSEKVSWIFPPDNDADLFHTVCSRIDRFNSEPARAYIRSEVPEAAASLLPRVEGAQGVGDPALATTFGYADRLAAHYQRITHRVLRLTLLLAAIMALTFEVYSDLLPLRIVPLGYLLCFALLTLIVIWHSRLDAQGRYLDYRALAEGLRVQFYWRVAGLTDNASSSYLRKQLDELRWIREALRASGATPPPSRAQPSVALQCWVHGQAAYYSARARLHEGLILRMEHWSRGSLIIGLLAAFSLVVFWHPLERLVVWHHWTVLIMGIAPVGAALWEAYAERIGARTQANQYARFAAIFLRAERFMTRLESEPQTPLRLQGELVLLRELGREALIENADWVLLLRDRPMSLPKG